MAEINDREILQKKQDLRNALRQIYWKKITEPIDRNPGSYLMDPGLQRFIALQPTRWQYFRPTVYSGALYTIFLIIPMIGTMYMFKTTRENAERKYRTGQVAYADRSMKFI